MDKFEKISHTVDALYGTGVSKQIPKDIDFKFSKKPAELELSTTMIFCCLLQGRMVELPCRFIVLNSFQKTRNLQMIIV